MILRYSHNIPQKSRDIKCITRAIETSGTIARSNNKAENNKNNLHQIVSRRTLHNWWRIRATGFLHSKETTAKNKEGGNSQPSKQQEKGQH